jgi:hypothetical protein
MSNTTFIMQVICGQADGDRFIRETHQCSPPDALANAIIEIMSSDGPGNPKLRGFCRMIQKKRLEHLKQRSDEET